MVFGIGCDTHRDTFDVSVVDGVGREVFFDHVPNTPEGYDLMVGVCERFSTFVVGIEGASAYGRPLAVHLSEAGVGVVEVPSRISAAMRRADGPAKSDHSDARAVARAAAAGQGHVWSNSPEAEALRVVVNHRNSLVKGQNQDVNHIRALLVEVDPQASKQLKRARSARAFKALGQIEYDGDIHHQIVTDTIRSLAAACLTRHQQIKHLETRIAELLPPAAHVMIEQTPGMGVITAGRLFAELAGTTGFATAAQFATWTGTAPLDASSGRNIRHRLNRGGNRQANAALYTIILTQLKNPNSETSIYVNRRMNENKTQREAIRAVKRHLARRIWKQLYQTPNNPN